MPKKSTSKTTKPTETTSRGSVYCNQDGSIVMKIQAKPGAKKNKITDITDDGIGVQINAPPVDGEANTELVKYLSAVLKVRKSDISLDRGSKSRQKTVTLRPEVSTVEEVKNKLETAIQEE